jgi:hypothetical protein
MLRMFPPSFIAIGIERSREVLGRRRRLAPPLKPVAARPVTSSRQKHLSRTSIGRQNAWVTQRPTHRPGPTGGDLEYDLAHEAIDDAAVRRESQPGPGAVVTTETADSGSDYGYDLAHEIPRQRSPRQRTRP